MKKQLNYKSLNTLGDVDITQSVVPGGGEAEVKDTMEYYSIDWDKAKELGYDETNDTSLVGFTKQTQIVIGSANTVKIAVGGTIQAGAGAAALLYGLTQYVTQVAYNFPIYGLSDGEWIEASNLNDYISKFVVKVDISSIFTPITKEEFYKLPVALTIYGPTEDDAIDYEDKMKTTFDTLWAIWERDGIDGQDLNITIPNADIASVTLIGNEGTHVLDITSMLGNIDTTTSEIIHSIRFNGQYGATLSKTENLTTGEITYEYIFMS